MVSQPPFSKQIQDLEEELGVNLFQRERKGVALGFARSCRRLRRDGPGNTAWGRLEEKRAVFRSRL